MSYNCAVQRDRIGQINEISPTPLRSPRGHRIGESSEIPLLVSRQRELVDEWALVLAAEGLSASVRRDPEGFVLSARLDEAERAADVLSAYVRENRDRDLRRNQEARSEPEPVAPGGAFAGVAVSVALVAFFCITGPRNPEVRWFERGSADAGLILLGELWRTVTALTLHADFAHALANALVGAVFVGSVCGALGSGVGCALILFTGAAGNLANALFHGSGHLSVGASTAVFGAVGLLSGLAVARRRRQHSLRRHAWIPVGAGLAILAMLGTAGERVDLWAHLYGLLAGGLLGIPVGFALSRPPRPLVQWIFGGAALAAVPYCWALALN